MQSIQKADRQNATTISCTEFFVQEKKIIFKLCIICFIMGNFLSVSMAEFSVGLHSGCSFHKKKKKKQHEAVFVFFLRLRKKIVLV